MDQNAAVDQTYAAMVKRIIAIGDIHGNARALDQLWSNVMMELGEAEVANSDVVFLGDYCDRGPDSKAVIDWLVQFKTSRCHVPGQTRFLAGNHDWALACFLGCPPVEISLEDLDSTRPPHFQDGYWPFEVPGGMHYMGRRWAVNNSYECASTMKSYGVEWTGRRLGFQSLRSTMLQAVPSSHCQFLSDLEWIVDVQTGWEKPGRVLCVHAGLLTNGDDVEAEISALKARDLTASSIYEHPARRDRISAFVGRSRVESPHPQLVQDGALLVSGHHGYRDMQEHRIIFDASGGHVSDHRPLEALVLPDRKVISHKMMAAECSPE